MKLKIENWRRWAFGIHKWRFVTFPVAICAFLFITTQSPMPEIKAAAYGFTLFYAFCFILVLTGKLKLPEK